MDEFRFQLSIKIDQHLLNLRGDDDLSFEAALKWAVEHQELIQAACTVLEGERTKQAIPTPAPPIQAVHPVSVREIGPIGIDGVDIKRGPRDGAPWKSPMYVVKFADGTSASTFEALDGKAAQTLIGASAIVSVKTGSNPKFLNIIKGGVRSAG